jgi:hypothetical protein
MLIRLTSWLPQPYYNAVWTVLEPVSNVAARMRRRLATFGSRKR